MEPRENNWFEHWLVVGSISSEARSIVHSVGGRVEDVQPLNGPHLVLVCLPYDETGNDERAISVRLDAARKALSVDVTCSDNPRGAHLIVYASTGVESIEQESVNDLVMVTEAEWFDIDDL